VLPIRISCRGKSAADVDIEMLSKIKDIELNNTLVTVRVWGCLKSGKVTDINFRDVFAKMYEKSAYFIMKNTSAMSSKEFEEIKVRPEPVEQTEISIIREQLAANKQELEIADQGFVHSLMNLLNKEKDEGENQSDFEDRIKAELSKKIRLQ